MEKIELDDIEENSVEENPLTIDEPINETFKRDAKSILEKLKHALHPSQDKGESLRVMRNWELWGPMIFCLCLALSLSVNSSTEDVEGVFTLVFALFWIGGFIVTLNAKLLGSFSSLLQNLCVLGYCQVPLVASSMVLSIMHYFEANFSVPFWLWELQKVALVVFALIWSTKSAAAVLGDLVGREKKTLAVYPVVLLYSSIAWMIIV
eukprot:snap_masked-scaffold_60-processed-gene-0.3-mRNA-1 protein AED:0.03 eAED:0.03 QI:0/-1/0/1/-1/1/1/0/206